MPKHRGMTFAKFIKAVNEELIRRFLDGAGHPLPADLVFSDTTVEQFLNNLPEEIYLKIDETWKTINDIADRGMNYIERAKEETGVTTPGNEPRERTATRLYLDCRSTFDIAHDRFLYLTLGAEITCYKMPDNNADFSQNQIELMKNEIMAYYTAENKGDGCVITHYVEDGKNYLLIKRGDFMKTDTQWLNQQTQPIFYRPGKEDVLVYDPNDKILGVKYSGKGPEPKRKYVELFGKHILKTTLPEEVYTTSLISLKPFQNETFDYNGNAVISEIKLIGIEGVY